MSANVGVRGRIAGPDTKGWGELLVDATDGGDEHAHFLGRTRTDAGGHFEVTWTTASYKRLLHASPDIVLTIRDPQGIHTIRTERPYHHVQDEILTADDIILTRRDVTGWLVTEGRGHALCVTHANEITPFIDGEHIFAAVLTAVQSARERIEISQLLFKPDFVADFQGGPRHLTDALIEAARRGVVVRILLNKNRLAPDHDDELTQVFAGAGMPDRLIVRPFPSSPEVMHAKCIITDNMETLLIGPPFEPRWWDTRTHELDEPRRGKGQPMHDVAVRVRGPAVADVAEFFAKLWNQGSRAAEDGTQSIARPPTPPAVGGVSLQLVHTMPEKLVHAGGGRGILEAYERAFAQAKDFIYIETQYLTSRSIFHALGRALEANPRLEAILLVNDEYDVPVYATAMEEGFARLGVPNHPRVGAFVRWSAHRESHRVVIQSVYLHTKTSIIDDVWATTGSANLDGYALDSADELGLPGVRCIETNVVFLDGIEGAPPCGLARGLREDLWGEHLGETIGERPSDGWLAYWRASGTRNQHALEEGIAARGFVLPYKAKIPRGVQVLGHDVNAKNRPARKRVA